MDGLIKRNDELIKAGVSEEVLEGHLSQAKPGTSTYEGLSQELSSRRGAKARIPISQKMREIHTTGDPLTKRERAQAFLDELRRNHQG